MSILNKLDTYVIPLCNNEPVCSIAFRLLRPCYDPGSIGSETISGGGGSVQENISGLDSSGGQVSSGPYVKLFDRSSWDQGQVPEGMVNLLNSAASAWESLVSFDPLIAQSLKDADPNWNGIVMNSYEEVLDTPSYVAACSVANYLELSDSSTGAKRYNSLSFNLIINTYYTMNTAIITHELGHALGLGTLWGLGLISGVWLDGIKYPLTQIAYDSNKNKIPVEDSGLSTSIGSHWENNERSPDYPGADGVLYPGIMDIMNAFGGGGITSLTVNFLIELGYVPAVSTFNSQGVDSETIFLSQNNNEKIKCGCDIPSVISSLNTKIKPNKKYNDITRTIEDI